MSLSTIPSKPSNSVILLRERETLKGLVYRDLNGNGQQDLDEPKVSNEVVLLEQSVEGEDGARFWKLITQTRTNQGGEFRFENVPDGEYRVRLSGSQTELRIRLTSTGTTQTNGESRISENHTPEDGQSAKSANRTLSEQLVDRVMQSFGG